MLRECRNPPPLDTRVRGTSLRIAEACRCANAADAAEPSEFAFGEPTSLRIAEADRCNGSCAFFDCDRCKSGCFLLWEFEKNEEKICKKM